MKAPKTIIREKYALKFMTIIELWSIHIDHPVADPNTMSNGICFHTKDCICMCCCCFGPLQKKVLKWAKT